MSIQIQCTRCHKIYSVADRAEGHKVRCKQCQELFIARRLTDSDETAAGQPAITADEDSTQTQAGAANDSADTGVSDQPPVQPLKLAGETIHEPEPLSFDQFMLHWSARPLSGAVKLWTAMGLLILGAVGFLLPSFSTLTMTGVVLGGLSLVMMSIASFIVPVAAECERTGQSFSNVAFRYRQRTRRVIVRVVCGIVLIGGSFIMSRLANIGQAVRGAGWQFPQNATQWADAWAGRPLTPVHPTEPAPSEQPSAPLFTQQHPSTQPDAGVSNGSIAAIPTTPAQPTQAPGPSPDSAQPPILADPADTQTRTTQPATPSAPPVATITIVGQTPRPPTRALGNIQRRLALQQGERLLPTGRDSSFLILSRQHDGEQSLRRVDIGRMAVDMEIHRPSSDMERLTPAPDGTLVLRQIVQPRPGIDVLTFNQGALSLTTLSDGPLGAPGSVLGFISPTEFLFYGQSSARSAVSSWDLNTGRMAREWRAPVVPAQQISVSPDGQTLIMPSSEETSATPMLWNLGSNSRRRITLTLTSPNDLDRANVAFSADGKQVALLIDHRQKLEIVIISVADGKILQHHVLPGIQQALPGAAMYHGRRIDWLDNDRALLLYGAILLEPSSGRSIGMLGIPSTINHALAGDGRLMLETQSDGETELLEVKLAPSVAQKLDSARQAGPILLAPPILANPAWNTRSARTLTDSGATTVRPIVDPAPQVSDHLLPKPLSLGAPLGRITGVWFTRTGTPEALVAIAPDPNDRFWQGAEPALEVSRYDLISGRQVGQIKLPAQCQMIAASPNGQTLLTSTDGETTAMFRDTPGQQRLDLWSAVDGTHLGGFEPYLDAPADQRDIVYASMPDQEGLLTLSSGGVLIRWSIADKRALWGWTHVQGAPRLTPGGQAVLVRVGSRLRLIDVRNGQLRGGLETMPQESDAMLQSAFSSDGKSLAGISGRGVVLWDVGQGRIASVLPITPPERVQFCGQNYLLSDQQLYAMSSPRPIMELVIPEGRALPDGPDDRFWYLADNAEGVASLCAVTLPPDSIRPSAGLNNRPASLMAAGAPVAVMADVKTFSMASRQALEQRLLDRGNVVDNSAPITLKMQAELIQKSGQVRVSEEGVETNLPYQLFRCQLSVISRSGNTLWRGTMSEVQPPATLPPASRAGETLGERYHRGLVENVLAWAAHTPLPDYIAPDGTTDEAPKFKLTARMKPELVTQAEGNPGQ